MRLQGDHTQVYTCIHTHTHTQAHTQVYTCIHTHTQRHTQRVQGNAFNSTYFQVNKDTVLFYHPIWLSYENIFERQLEALGKKGDILFGISTSGNSKNVTLAFKKAKKLGIKTIALLGKNKGTIGKNADYILNTPSDITNNIQEMHIAIEHLICELIENNIKEKK